MFNLITLRHHWEWIMCGTVMFTLILFLAGIDIFGLHSVTASLLGIVGGVLVMAVSLVSALVLAPLVAVLTLIVSTGVAVVTTLLAFLVGGIFTPIAAFFVGWITTLISWLATTWLGTLLTPLYSTLTPLLVKILPWISATKYGHKLYDWLDDQPWWPRALVLTPTQKNARVNVGRHTTRARRNRSQSK